MLDRDGVINVDRPNSVLSVDDFELLPDVPQAIALLNQHHIPVAVVTNQACIGRGELAWVNLEDIHQKMKTLLAQKGAHLDQIYVCPDISIAPHFRRKPAPGMLQEALRDFKARPSYSPLIGDAYRDLQAAASIGCPRILVRTGKGKMTEREIQSSEGCDLNIHPVHIFDTLYQAVQALLKAMDASSDPFYTSNLNSLKNKHSSL